MNPPLISVIMPAYNYAHTLVEAVESVLQQGRVDVEILILDDCSSDDTAIVAQQYANNPQVRYIRHTTNLGIVANLNFGIHASLGALLLFLSADDMLKPTFFDRVLAFRAEHPEIDIVYTEIDYLLADGQIREPRQPLIACSYVEGRNEFAGLLAQGCYMFFGSLVIPRRLFEQHGLFDENVHTANDLELLIRWASRDVRFGHLAEHLVTFRVHSGQLSGRKSTSRGEFALEFLHILDKHLTPDRRHRIRGFEHEIARHIRKRLHYVQSSGYVDDGDLALRTQQHIDALHEIRRANREQLRPCRLGAIIIDSGTPEDLEASVNTVLSQTSPGWELIIASPRAHVLRPMFAPVADDSRLRLVAMPADMALADMLNQAILISAADAWIFLRAGATVAHDHLALMQQHVSDMDCDVILQSVRITGAGEAVPLGSADSDSFDIIPSLENVNHLLVAPCLPLEAFVVKREAFDARCLFKMNASLLPEWEFALRVRAELDLAIAPHLHVQIPAECALPAHHSSCQALVTLTDDLYQDYVVNDTQTASQRMRYRETLVSLVDRWEILQHNQQGRGQLARLLYDATERPSLASSLNA